MVDASSISVPEGFTLHTENSAHILLPATQDAFLNPVQEFNRDLSVACIRTWTEETNAIKEEKWRRAQERKAANGKEGVPQTKRVKTSVETSNTEASMEVQTVDSSLKSKEFKPAKFILLEALSATGLRSIRYANEIPLLKYVIANDLSPEAVAAMKRNIEINGLGPTPVSEASNSNRDSASGTREGHTHDANNLGKVRVNEGDACALMYNHRQERQRVDVVDLDPYGTAAPFIDPAVQCINDGGLLCVTCTDMSVLATANYPEKCFSNYGGIPVKTEYCHEAGLRLVLHTLATSAARYGRYIEPLLSLSIDFYVRLFVRVRTAPIEVKKLASQTAVYYVCSGCQTPYEQHLGRVVEKTSAKGNVNPYYKTQSGPPVSNKCAECESPLQIAGPMWSGPIHNKDFVSKVLTHLEANEGNYGTAARMRGMLTVAQEELETPFYFTPGKVAGNFHCVTPSLDDIVSALFHAGHDVSRSHAVPGSLKTTASRAELHDIYRSWIKRNPVNIDKVSETSPAQKLLAPEPKIEANFERHPRTVTAASKVKIVRYQVNPLPNWGPGTRPEKRKHADEEA